LELLEKAKVEQSILVPPAGNISSFKEKRIWEIELQDLPKVPFSLQF
jgi:hypothetical protein